MHIGKRNKGQPGIGAELPLYGTNLREKGMQVCCNVYRVALEEYMGSWQPSGLWERLPFIVSGLCARLLESGSGFTS